MFLFIYESNEPLYYLIIGLEHEGRAKDIISSEYPPLNEDDCIALMRDIENNFSLYIKNDLIHHIHTEKVMG